MQKFLSLWRVLIPSWRFFDTVGDQLSLWCREETDTDHWSEWQIVLTPPQRHLTHLFLNSKGNLSLAQNGLLERLCEDINDHIQQAQAPEDSTIETRLSYQLVVNLVRAEASPQNRFQFKIVATTPSRAKDVILSKIHSPRL